MELSHVNSNSHQTSPNDNMPSKDFYSINNQTPEKRRLTLRTAVCAQIVGVTLFALGLIVGILIGIYGFHGGPNRDSPEKNTSKSPPSLQSELIQGQRKLTDNDLKISKNKIEDINHHHSHKKDGHLHEHDRKKKHQHDHDHKTKLHGDHDHSNEVSTRTDKKYEQTTTTPNLNIQRPNMFTTLPRTPLDHPHDHGHDHSHANPTAVPTTPDPTPCQKCEWRYPIAENDEPELFAPINATEMRKARDALFRDNITTVKPGQELEFNESYVLSMYLFPPVKKEALSFLDEDGPFPGRYVTATVIGGAMEVPQLMKYKVGPLEEPLENVRCIPLLRHNEVPFSNRPYDAIETRRIILFVMDEMYKVNEMMSESFDSRTPYKDLSVMPNGPFIHKGNQRTTRFTVGLRGIGDRDFDFVNVVPLNGLLYHGGKNMSEWYVYNIFYVNQGPFDSFQDLYDAYVNGSIHKIQYPKGTREVIKETTFPKRNEYTPLRENSYLPGTKTFEPLGPRYTISGHTITWLGWRFSVTSTQHRGPAVFDIRFRNERVVYENALNEIGLLYSADGSGQDNILYTDSTYGLGESKVAIGGIDCPAHAAFIKTVMWNPVLMGGDEKLTLCLFEMDAQEPLWRHKGNDIEGGMRNRYLVARYPTQLGNYDYIIDFQFHLDGKIVTTATATGFIQANFWSPFSPFLGDEYQERTPFGYRVSSAVSGPIHDHTFSFKVDMDIIEKENDFELIHWKYGNVMDALKSKNKKYNAKFPNYFFHNQTRFVEWEHLKTETYLDIDSKNPKFWTIINNKYKNEWNVSRGYRIIPMSSGTQNIENDHPYAKELSFTQHHVTITKRQEDEQYVKPIYNPGDIKDPEPSRKFVDDMLNEESIENQDLVTWLALGFLHVPTSEDVPMTTRVTSGFTLKPFNFFSTTATFDMPGYAMGVNKTVFDREAEVAPCMYVPLSVQG